MRYKLFQKYFKLKLLWVFKSNKIIVVIIIIIIIISNSNSSNNNSNNICKVIKRNINYI